MFGADHLPSNPFAIATDPQAFIAVETVANAAIAVLAVMVAVVCGWPTHRRAGRSSAA